MRDALFALVVGLTIAQIAFVLYVARLYRARRHAFDRGRVVTLALWLAALVLATLVVRVAAGRAAG